MRCKGLLMMSRVVSFPKHRAVWGIRRLGKSIFALWPYWWPLAGCSGVGSLGRPGRERQICSRRLHSGQTPELVTEEESTGWCRESTLDKRENWGTIKHKPCTTCIYHHPFQVHSECTQRRERNSERGQRTVSHLQARHNNPQRSRRSHDSPGSSSSRELRSEHEWHPASKDRSDHWPLTWGQKKQES